MRLPNTGCQHFVKNGQATLYLLINMENQIAFSIRVDQATADLIQKLAKANCRSVAGQVRYLLNIGVTQELGYQLDAAVDKIKEAK